MSNLGPHRRSSKREHCPICDKPDGCIIFNDGRGVACLRIESDHQTPGGWFYHRLGNQTDDWRDHLSNFQAMPSAPVIDAGLCDRTYRAFLNHCPLTDAHRDDLHRRGIPDDEIQRGGYGSMPEKDRRVDIVRSLMTEIGLDFVGHVPGFYYTQAGYSIAGERGLIIPVRDAKQRIERLHIRVDNPKLQGRGKYRWVSSLDLKNGVGSGTRPHVALPNSIAKFDRVGVTEGVLKGNIAARRLGIPFISISGVNVRAGLLDILRELGVKEVVDTFDRDAETNEHVARARAQMQDELTTAGFVVLQMTWPDEFNGIDDALVAGIMPMIERDAPRTDRTADEMTCPELRRKYKELSELHSAVMQTLRNSALNPTERIVAISLMKNINWASSRETDEEAFHIPAVRIAEDAGVSQSTAAAAIKTIETGLVIPARGDDSAADPEPVHLFDRTVKFSRKVAHKGTGEIRDVKQAYYTPRTENLRESLVLLARVEKIKPRAHGGKRSVVCPDHPDANIVVRWNRHCGECDRLLESGETVQSPRAAIVEEPVAGLNEQDAILVADEPMGTVKRTVKSSTFHKSEPNQDYAVWAKANPIASAWMPPPPSVVPKRVIVHGEEVF